MEHFLCELFDIPSMEFIKIKELFDIANSTLLYDKIYEHPRIQSSLVYGFAWLSIFGVYPSKIDVFSMVEKSPRVSDVRNIIDNVLKECNFTSLVQNINTEQIAQHLSNFIQNIKIKTNVKKYLVKKMNWRLNPFMNIAKYNDMTLLTAFLEMCNIKKVEQINGVFTNWKKQIVDQELLEKNVLTNNYLYNINNKTDSFTTLTPFECMSRTMYCDLYMMRMLMQSTCVFITNDADPDMYVPVLNSIAKTSRSLFIVEREQKTCGVYEFYNHPKCVPLDSICNVWQNIWLLIPKISLKVILITKCAMKTHEEFDLILPTFRGPVSKVIVCENHEFVDGYRSEVMIIHIHYVKQNELKAGMKASSQAALVKGLFLLPINTTLNITDILMKYLMGLTNPYSLIGVQNTQNNTLAVFDMITRYYFNLCISDIQATKIKAKSDYVVVLIDNRDNPMSIMSSYISLSNLKDQVWSMVVITSNDSVEYYKKHCPLNTHVITHPILNLKPFDIEMYNALLKDEELGKTLLEFGTYCLMIQDDGIIIKKGIENLIINKQVKYDYIGSAWRVCQENKELSDMCHTMIGNGGLSFRNCAIMLKVCQECLKDKYMLMNKNMQPIAEDVFFSKCVEKVGGKIAPMDIALNFAFEQVMFMEAYGFHKFWVYHNIHDVDYFIHSITIS